jgi:hypothetical protein
MAKINTSLNEFNNKVINNLELAYKHMEKVVELSNNINFVSNDNDYDKLIEVLNDLDDLKIKLKELEDWSLSTLTNTKNMLFNMSNDAYKLPTFYVTERVKLTK